MLNPEAEHAEIFLNRAAAQRSAAAAQRSAAASTAAIMSEQ
jgi:hypothetical protein